MLTYHHYHLSVDFILVLCYIICHFDAQFKICIGHTLQCKQYSIFIHSCCANIAFLSELIIMNRFDLWVVKAFDSVDSWSTFGWCSRVFFSCKQRIISVPIVINIATRAIWTETKSFIANFDMDISIHWFILQLKFLLRVKCKWLFGCLLPFTKNAFVSSLKTSRRCGKQ